MTDHTDAKGRALVRYAADLVVFSGPLVLTVERGTDPYAGRLALPGGHVDHGETSRAAAVREAAEETGLAVAASQLRRVDVFDDPDRDPRGRVVSVAYAVAFEDLPAVVGGDDATRAVWVETEAALRHPMAFDHRDILGRAYALLLDGELDR